MTEQRNFIDTSATEEFTPPTINDVLLAEPLRIIWGGLEGKILVVTPSINETKLEKFLERYSDLHERSIVVNAIKELSFNDPLTFGGDMYARDAITSMLHLLYNEPDKIQTYYDLNLSNNFQELKDANVVLIGGPRANRATKFFLDKLQLSWPFEYNYKSSIDDHDKIYECKMREDGRIYKDYGLAVVKAKNPLNDGRFVYVAAGCRSFGTRAAGSILTMAGGAEEVISYLRESGKSLDDVPPLQLVVETAREKGEDPLEVDGFENMVMTVSPFNGGSAHYNIKDIIKTREILFRASEYLRAAPIEWLRENAIRSPRYRFFSAILFCFFGIFSVVKFGLLSKLFGIPATIGIIIISIGMIADSVIKSVQGGE